LALTSRRFQPSRRFIGGRGCGEACPRRAGAAPAELAAVRHAASPLSQGRGSPAVCGYGGLVPGVVLSAAAGVTRHVKVNRPNRFKMLRRAEGQPPCPAFPVARRVWRAPVSRERMGEMMGHPRRPLIAVECVRPCPSCGARPGQRCSGSGGRLLPEPHAARWGTPAERRKRYAVVLCGGCYHPGGQHSIRGGCRLCRDCPGWDEARVRRGWWSDWVTDELRAALGNQDRA
jgi:hypothetical protein